MGIRAPRDQVLPLKMGGQDVDAEIDMKQALLSFPEQLSSKQSFLSHLAKS